MSEWKEYKIGDMCLKVTDGAHNSPPEVTEGYPMFSVKDMDENGFDFSDVKLISRNDFDKLVKSDCKPLKNDVLIAKDGSYLKHVFVCKEEKEEVILSSIAILRPNVKIVNAFFLKYILKTSSVKNMMEGFVSGSALPRIVLKDFKKMVLQIPSVPTQHRIAYILSAYDDLIENNNRRIALLEQMAEQIYKEWFVRMRFPGYQNTEFEKGVPKGWEVKSIKDFGKVVTGKTPSTSNSGYFGGKFPFIKTPDMHGNIFVLQTEETLTEDGFNSQKSQALPANSICVSCIGTGGVVSITPSVCMTNQQINSLILKNKMELEFLFFTLRGLKTMIEMFGSTGATMTNLSKGKFENLKFIKPKDEFIEKFCLSTKPILNEIKNLSQQQITLKQIRDLLLPRLISGKLKVNELKEFELV